MEKFPLDEALVAAVLPLRARRTLVFERYTHADWEEVRGRLPEEYRPLSDQRLMEQGVRLRKGGRFESQDKKTRAALKRDIMKAVTVYWSGGTTLEQFVALLNKLKPAGPGIP